MTKARELTGNAALTRRRLGATGLAFGLACAVGLFTAHDAQAKDGKAATQRLVTIGGDVTEIVDALGLGDQIVAVDTTSKYPPEIFRSRPKVGYMRALSAEGVLSVGATMILASEDSGPPEAVKALKAASTTYVTVPGTPSPDGIATKIAVIGKALGREAQAQAMAKRVTSELASLKAARARITTRKKVLFVLSVRAGRLVVGGAGTSADAVIKLAGGVNAAAKVPGFKPITAEALVEMAPDAIIRMAHTARGPDSEGLTKMAALKLVPAGQNKAIRDFDGVLLLGFGPRTPRAVRQLMAWLYPSLLKD